MGNIGDLVATATLDISPFMSNTRNLKTYMKGLDNSLKAVEKSFQGHGGRIKGLKAVYAETGSALKGYQELLKTQSQKYSDLKKEIGDVNNATAEQKQKLIGAKSAMLETAAKVTELQNRLRSLATETSVFTRFGKAAERIGGKMKSFGDSVAGVGAAFTRGVTAPIVAGAGYAIKAAVDYETAFAGVKKTVDETATVSYAKLSQGIRQMAKELPASAVEIAHVAEAAGQLGVKTGDILSFSRTMIDLGESTNLSAEEAATSIAKIANITGLASSEYSRFGSAVVALGNNFATTERDIVAMTNRIAASGKLAGLTNQEMLALATAMSSVGIEAEAGGTAMTQSLSAIERAVASGGDNLNKFAQIANMSSADFARAWKEKPIVALQEFIKGLGQLDKKGESATKVLDDLGLSGIRQSNMLKSLGLASETLGKALDTSNKAWQENTALTDEANKRYETTESKLKMLKNEVNDVAIEFGGPLVDALRNGLEAGKPIIQMAADLAKQFNSLDKEQQQQIVKWGLIAAAAGPALSIFGKGVGIIGGTIQAMGKMSRGLGTLSGWLRTFRTGAVAASAGAEAATASMGGMAGAVALLSNPVTWGVLLGGAAIVGIGLIADSMYKAQKRTEEWGIKVSQVQANELQRFKNKVDEANLAMTTFGVRSANNLDKIKTSFKALADEIEALQNKKLKKDLKLAEKLGLSQETIEEIRRQADQTVATVRGMSDKVVDIYRRAKEERRSLTEEEKTVVTKNLNDMIQTELSLMNYSKKEKIAILKAMNGEIETLNYEQLKKAQEVAQKMIESENKTYKKRRSNLKEMYDNIKGDSETAVRAREEIHRQLETLEDSHTAKMESLGERYLKIRKKLLEDPALDPRVKQAMIDSLDKEFEKLGLSFEKLSKRSEEAISKTKISMQDMTSSFRASIGEAISSLQGWDNLTPQEKQLLIDGNKAVSEILNSKTLLEQWQALTPQQKELLAKNLTQDPTLSAQQAIDNVKQRVPADVKASDKTAPDVASADRAVNRPKQKGPAIIRAQDNASSVASGVIGWLNSIPRTVTSTITTIVRKITGHKTGTDYHPGGLAMVNDQKGPLYRELITLPTGESFIPEGRNVILPLPRGSKVLRASRTKQLFSHYANGIGFNDTKIASLTTRLKSVQDKGQVIVNTDPQLAELIKLLKDRDNRNVTNNYTLNATNRSNSDDMFNQENMRRLLRELAYYTNGEKGRLA
ncbi:phage tail protein [Streptococcus equi subsp. equi]|uniref:phage tail tape measure protein n=1 Tax=Streptococcus equi TaxID=1336 RepID=UPI000658B77E|nr:phage tail tape measure protein [Streptococcus equi]CRS47703.1 phage tail protein [Streptococcus equi subsp. equi]CRS55319.1 phage tail protein [Streptococcus equi subsp. equi]CRS58643.1 phage tail protein [Streptococcus equi subsp. equi]